MTYKKKLIEVALPLEAINQASLEETSNPFLKGHPKGLKWWARRPLAACRGILFASLVDDPSASPSTFASEGEQDAERLRLFRILEELVKWGNTNNTEVLEAARKEIRKARQGPSPRILDPFCGRGSIPLEAQRLGLDVFASDLNPVAVLIAKALMQVTFVVGNHPPVNPDAGKTNAISSWAGGQGLAADVRYYGKQVLEQAERMIGHLYPRVDLPPAKGGGTATVTAWIWARTVKSPNPAWDATVPLVKSFALSTKKDKEVWAQPIIDRDQRRINFQIRSGSGWPEGTVGRNGATCLATGSPIPLSYIRNEGKEGRLGSQLMAIVVQGKGRVYLDPTEEQEQMAASILPCVDAPDTDLPYNPRYLTTANYGMRKHRDLFTNRQQSALATLSRLILNVRADVRADAIKAGWQDDEMGVDSGGSGATAYADAVVAYLAQALGRLVMFNNQLCKWNLQNQNITDPFGLQTLSMNWDFVEACPLRSPSGFLPQIEVVTRIIEESVVRSPQGSIEIRQLDARVADFGVDTMVVTDPPYYDNVGYADLSDLFYVWLRPVLREIFPQECSTLLTPKSQELVADPYRHDGSRPEADAFFEEGFGRAFKNLVLAHNPAYPMTLFYAFKQSETEKGLSASTGWERMLTGLVEAGLIVVGTWPLRTERQARVRSLSSNALATSVVFACRLRSTNAALGSRKELLLALKQELPDALRHLQQGNIAPVDLAQAAIGPGMAVFSRYSKVVEADGRPMTVRTALGLINQVLDETLAEQESDFDPDTRWALAWFEQFGMSAGPFGVAESLSKAKNTAVNALVIAGFLESKGGKVRLLDRGEFASTWDPAADTRLTVWEVTQHLMRALESDGEAAAGELLRRVGGLGETARELAYRLYVLCERKKWAKEALAYNGLVVAWPEISRLAAGEPVSGLIQETLL